MATPGWVHPAAGLWERQNGGGFGMPYGNTQNNDDSSSGNMGGGYGMGTFQAQSNPNATKFLSELIFANVKSIRTSTIILAVFNVVTAFATAIGILWDNYARKRRNNPKFTFMASGFTFVGAAETFPLVLSISIVIQGVAFAGAQSTGLQALAIIGCSLTSQMMLPALFLVPYINLVFGVEMAVRALRRDPFRKRGKWNVTICLAMVMKLVLATFLITHFILPPDFCLASLFYFVVRWKEFCFAATIAIATILLACTAIIFWQLQNSPRVEPTERVAASRMVFYLPVAAASLAIIAPFFFTVIFYNDLDDHDDQTRALNLSMMAGVVVNLSGLLMAGLHLFLRSNTISTIGPMHKYEVERQKMKRGIRVWSPDSTGSSQGSSLRYANHIIAPIRPLERVDSTDTLVDRMEKEEELIESPTGKAMNPLTANAVYPMATPATITAMPVMVPSPLAVKKAARDEVYSTFSRADTIDTKSVTLLPATTYSPTDPKAVAAGLEPLKPPPTLLSNRRHERESSVTSLATVQIGLRFSNVEDMPPLNSKYFDQTKVYDLDCPKNLEANASKRPHPLAQAEGEAGATTSANVPAQQSSAEEKKRPALAIPSSPANGQLLSPSVYSSQSPSGTKVTSPRGVGFTVPQRNGSSGSNSSPRSPLKMPPAPARRTAVKKADWI